MSRIQPRAYPWPGPSGKAFGNGSIRREILGALTGLAMIGTPDALAESTVKLSFGSSELRSQESGPPPAYFSGHTVTLSLQLEGIANCPEISARLVQISSRLEAELHDRQAFECGDLSPAPGGATADAAFSFQVPEVDRVSRFEWRFVRCATEAAPCDHLATIVFDTYPNHLLDPLRAWAAEHVLVARDPTGELQRFLEQSGVEFFERATPSDPQARVMTLLLERGTPGERSDYEAYLAKGDLVVFRERVETLPLIRTRDIGNRRLTTVELVIVARLNADPTAQRTFLDILNLPGK